MNPRIWNRPFPEKFLLGGEQRFSSELPQLNKGWVLRRTSDSPEIIAVEQLGEIPGNEFSFFPRFSEISQHLIDSRGFDRTPVLDSFSWDWIEFRYKPLVDLEVKSIYWSPDSGVICGESWISNCTEQKRSVVLDLVCILQSQGAGNQISLDKITGRPILTGRLGNQYLTLFMAGDSEFREDPSPYLLNELSLSPQSEEKIHWICIKSESPDMGKEMLEKVLQLDWVGEISRRKVSLQSQIEIKTGDPDWDFVLALSQKQAQLILQQISALENHKTPAKTVITPIQALMLLQSNDNQTPEIAKNILDFVFKQNRQLEDEEKHAYYEQTPPILAAELLWQIHLVGYTSDIWSIYLEKASNWLNDWFSPHLDKDDDGIPELINPRILQLPGSQSAAEQPYANCLLPYPYLESPGLGAILFNELCKIDDLFLLSGESSDLLIREKKDNLRKYIQDSWIPEDNEFHNRDSHSHNMVKRFNIIENLQPGLNILKVDLPQPARIGVLHHRLSKEHPPEDFRIICHGQDWRGNHRIEELHGANFIWGDQFDWMISESVYSKIDYCILDGFDLKSQISLLAPPTSKKDITLTLPLWAKALPDDQTVEIIENMLLDPDRFWSPYGFSSSPESGEATISLFWNLLLGQTLLKLGRNNVSAELIKRWMDVIIPTLGRTGSTYPGYEVKTGQGIGVDDSMESLFPIRFFLRTLGIEILQNGKIIICGDNPFPWPVSLRYKGYEIMREKDQTTVTHPGKEDQVIKNPCNFHLDPA